MGRPDRTLSMLGIAMKAGKVKSGEFSTENAVKDMEAWLVIVAKDASDNTRKHFRDMCEYRNIPYMEYSDREELGKAIGREFRASLAVTDKGIANVILGYMDSES